MIINRHTGAEKHVQKKQKHCFIMNPRTLYKKKTTKTPVVEMSRRSTFYTQTLYTWALPSQLHSTQTVHMGTALTAIR